jgi:hypothetical protein
MQGSGNRLTRRRDRHFPGIAGNAICGGKEILRFHRLMQIGRQGETAGFLLPAGQAQAVQPGRERARIECL